MEDFYGLDATKLKEVHVKMKVLGIVIKQLCYDEGNDVWKEEDGYGLANSIRLLRAPNSGYSPEWKKVARLEHIENVRILDWSQLQNSSSSR